MVNFIVSCRHAIMLSLCRRVLVGVMEKKESWAALVELWLGDDEKWAARSIQNRANRGTDGTHGQGNRNHLRHKKV